MDTAHHTPHDIAQDTAHHSANHTALLLERAYRLALVLHGRHSDASAPDEGDVDPRAFEQLALAAELVALLDDARAGLVRRG
jgi:hypothetical protein